MSGLSMRLILLLLVLALAGLIAMNFEKVETLENIGPTAEVRRNAYSAAEHFLEKQGIEVSDERGRVDPKMLGDDDVLLLSDVSFLQGSGRQAQALLDWVADGGRLIWHLDASNKDSPLARLMGVSLLEVARNDSDKKDRVSRQSNRLTIETDEEITALTPSQRVRPELNRIEQSVDQASISYWYGHDQPYLRSVFHTNETLSYKPSTAGYPMQLLGYAKNDERIGLLHFRLGHGHVSVLADTRIWQNNRIGLFDHALLLATLSSGADQFYLQHDVDVPTLTELIRQYALAPMLVLWLLLLFWVLGQSRRFGPLEECRREQRRSLAEHVGAVARFHQQHKQLDHLLAPLRRQAMARACRDHIQFEQLSTPEQLALLSRRTGHREVQLRRALYGKAPYRSDEFLDIVQLLTSIRDQL